MMSPKISFVVAARNDDYGGNFLRRMQVFINSLVALATDEKLRGELVIVEWNPPSSASSLRDALTWPHLPEHFLIRFILVPEDVHRRYENSDRMPMFEYIAKNVGIRRAAGDYIVATNPDLIFSRELIRFFSTSGLDARYFYRVDRHDVGAMVPEEISVDRQIAFCRSHTFLVNTVAGSAPPHRWGNSHLFLRLKETINRVRGIVRGALGGRPLTRLPQIHTNASGDFFMMAGEHWHALRAYPELTTHSFIDGYICFMAASMGLRQRILGGRRRIYHQDHDRTDHASRPTTDYRAYLERCQAMIDSGKPEITNPDNWGLGDLDLQECEVHS